MCWSGGVKYPINVLLLRAFGRLEEVCEPGGRQEEVLVVFLRQSIGQKKYGSVAEWLGRGLQNLLQQFESARNLR